MKRLDNLSPAGQLGSVAARYWHPLTHPSAGGSLGQIQPKYRHRSGKLVAFSGKVLAMLNGSCGVDGGQQSELGSDGLSSADPASGERLTGGSGRGEGRASGAWGRRIGGLGQDDSREIHRLSSVDAGSSLASVERDERLCRLEAVLLLAREPLHPRKLSKFANLADATEALTLVSRLNHLYDRAARAFRVEEVAGGWQLRSRPQFATWLRRLQHVPSALRLSAPAMETLAVVAYRQPVVRVDIEAVRGVACGEILRQLMERDLVRVSGRSDDLGRPYYYSTTQYFLQTFGLRDLDELPRADWFRQALEEESQIAQKEPTCALSVDDEVIDGSDPDDEEDEDEDRDEHQDGDEYWDDE